MGPIKERKAHKTEFAIKKKQILFTGLHWETEISLGKGKRRLTPTKDLVEDRIYLRGNQVTACVKNGRNSPAREELKGGEVESFSDLMGPTADRCRKTPST